MRYHVANLTGHHGLTFIRFILHVSLITLAITCHAQAQLEAVRLQIESTGIGVGGYYQVGSWTPMVVTLENPSPQPRRVLCEWSVPDADGDLVLYRRWVTLGPGPGNVQRAWLYAMLPATTSPQALAQVRVLELGPDDPIDSTGGRVLARAAVPLPRRVESGKRPIGIVGLPPGLMGLRPYETLPTQHEPLTLISGLSPAELPDRWYGLAMFQTLIWTPQAGDPGALDVSEPTRQALREWVQRGGHLIVILPSEGEMWTGSPLRDLLPVERGQLQRLEDVRTLQLPTWLGQPIREGDERFAVRWFALPADTKTTAVLQDDAGRPWVVAGPQGLGRVTIIGLDITDRRLASLQLPNPFTQNHNPVHVQLWPTVLGLRGPVYTDAYLAAERLDNPPPNMRYRWVDLTGFVAGLVAMRETAAPALLAAIIVFGIYWLSAGPGSYAWLKRRGKVRHAWLVYAGLVLAFTLLTWAGAFLMRPQRSSIAHFTIVDIDAVTNMVRKQSWLALYVPEHGRVNLQLGQPESNSKPANGTTTSLRDTTLHDTLSAPGLLADSQGGDFIDPQRYVVDAANPNRADVPMRSTAKLLELNVLEKAGNDTGMIVGTGAQKNKSTAWSLPTGKVTVGPAGPFGELKHQLPGTLRDVLLVYVPGDGLEPWVWRHREAWEPGQVLKLDGIQGQRMVMLPVAPNDRERPELRQWRGHLGDLMRLRGVHDETDTPETTLPGDRLVQRMELMSFFGMLPPPDFRALTYPLPVAYQRSMGQSLDMTARLGLRGLWLMGHLDTRGENDAPFPLPLSVDGRAVSARGWTMVRMHVAVE